MRFLTTFAILFACASSVSAQGTAGPRGPAPTVPIALSNVRPSLTPNDLSDGPAYNGEFFGELIARELTGSMKSPDFENHFVREFMPFCLAKVVKFWFHRPAFGASAFGSHVGEIIGVSSQKEMRWSHARRIIAVVTNEHALGNGADADHPREPLGVNLLSSDVETSVAFGKFWPGPYPALARLVYLVPEIFRSLGSSKGPARKGAKALSAESANKGTVALGTSQDDGWLASSAAACPGSTGLRTIALPVESLNETLATAGTGARNNARFITHAEPQFRCAGDRTLPRRGPHFCAIAILLFLTFGRTQKTRFLSVFAALFVAANSYGQGTAGPGPQARPQATVKPMAPADSVRFAAQDVQKLGAEVAKRTRYLAFGQATAKEKQTLFQVLSGHINSLSREPDIVRPVVVLANGVSVDGLGLAEDGWGAAVLMRLNLDDYGWDPKVYDGLAEIDPYYHVIIEEGSPAGTEIVTETVVETITVKKKVPWPGGIWQAKDGGDNKFYAPGEYVMDVPEKVEKKVQKKIEKKAKERVFAAAPWLADTAEDKAAIAALTGATKSQTPILLGMDMLWQTGIQAERKVGYYDLQGIKDLKTFEKLVGFDPKQSKQFSRELLAAVANSGVAHQPRRIARFEKIGGGYWSTFDNRLAQDKANPLRVLNGGFVFDASEVFAHGANGIFKLALFDKDGVRQDSAPDLVGADRTTASNDFRIHIGLSCWRCHQSNKADNGLNEIKDWARNLLKRPLALQSPDYDKLKELRQRYLRRLEPFMAADRTRHAEAIFEACGLTPFEWTNKLAAVWREYETPVTRARAARELGVTEECLVQALDGYVKSGGTPDTVISMFLRGQDAEPMPLESWREEFVQAQLILRSIKPVK